MTPSQAVAALCGMTLLAMPVLAGPQLETIKVFAPTADQLAQRDTSGGTDPTYVPQFVPRSIQSGVYNRPEDRGRPFYGQSWTEDWGSTQVAVSDRAVFVPVNGQPAFSPDRRPAIEIVMHNGTQGNPRGMAGAWYAGGSESEDRIAGYTADDRLIPGSNGVPDAFDYLISRLDQHYNEGFRRLILHLPAGAVDSTYMDSAQYWTMEDWRRKWFWLEVRRWIQEKENAGDPVSMGVYLGWKTHDPTVFNMQGAVPPDMSNPQHVEWMHQNLYPWIRLGFKEFWFDASASARPVSETDPTRQRDVLASLRNSPTWGPLAKFGGEAVPGNGRLIDHHLDTEVIDEAGWLGIPLYLETRFGSQLATTNPTPFFDPATTEATCWIRNSNRVGKDGESGVWQDYPPSYYERLRQQGMVFRAQEGRMGEGDYKSYVSCEYVKRLLGFGVIKAPVDFDSDGLIEIQRSPQGVYSGEDWDKFVTTVMAKFRTGGSGYFSGDINNDGFLDNADLILYRGFVEDYLRGKENGETVITPLDLGQPWWVPLGSGTYAAVQE